MVCFPEAILRCSLGKAECEGLSTSECQCYQPPPPVKERGSGQSSSLHKGQALLSRSAELAQCVTGEGTQLLPIYPTQLPSVIALAYFQE